MADDGHYDIDGAFRKDDLVGPSYEPTFAGALSFMRRRFSYDVSGADMAILGIPFDVAVTNRPGARFGPRAVRAASVILDNDPQFPFGADIFEKLKLVDTGDCPIDHSHTERMPELIYRCAKRILDEDVHLLSLGGDHFVTWPLLQAHAEKFGAPLAYIQFDAHQDTWDDDGTSISHGNFVTRAVNQGIIDPEKSIQVGIRTHAPADYGIKIVDGFAVDDMSPNQIADLIKERVGDAPTYLTFDIDCLDPAYAPGTGTPVAGGPSSAKMLAVLRQLGSLDLIGGDVVEVAPAYDHAEVTAIAASTVAMFYVALIAEKLK